MATTEGLATHKARSNQLAKSCTFDKALPGPHTLSLYKGKIKSQASTLCQLRTGINRLNSYLLRIGAADSEECTCKRGKETVDHFLFQCRRWEELRDAHNIKKLAKGRWGDIAYLLGGWSGERKDGVLDNWIPLLGLRWRHREEEDRESDRQDGGSEESDEKVEGEERRDRDERR